MNNKKKDRIRMKHNIRVSRLNGKINPLDFRCSLTTTWLVKLISSNVINLTSGIRCLFKHKYDFKLNVV